MRDLDAARLLFGSGRMVDPVESLSDVMRVAQRLLAERTEALGWWLHTEQSLSTPAQSVVVNLGQHKTDAPLTVELTFGKSDDQARAV